uniref:Carboxylesterase type B domain-containing protein n=1 Tax=Romanomermis culicivorax TaxID=13658 RepID=A0A915I698_ROMCU
MVRSPVGPPIHDPASNGAAIAPWAVAPKTTKIRTESLISRLECPGGWTILQCLKRVNVQNLMAVTEITEDFAPMGPVVDSYRRGNAILPHPAHELILKRRLQVPILMGLTSGEMPVGPDMKWDSLLPYNRLKNGPKWLKSVDLPRVIV